MQVNKADLITLLESVRACHLCDELGEPLPLGPKPILQLHPDAKILIAGQAPGRITHNKGIPFDDPSGERLREWLGVSKETFYDATKIAILPMGFCFPGTGRSGDLPPRPECAAHWRQKLLAQLPNIEMKLVIGRYAIDWHLESGSDASLKKLSLTQIVGDWQAYWSHTLPMPHPSPRNNRWLKNNPWFSAEVLPALKSRVAQLLQG